MGPGWPLLFQKCGSSSKLLFSRRRSSAKLSVSVLIFSHARRKDGRAKLDRMPSRQYSHVFLPTRPFLDLLVAQVDVVQEVRQSIGLGRLGKLFSKESLRGQLTRERPVLPI